MKWISYISCLWLIFLLGCNLREREMELKNKMSEINQKKQELSFKEKSLQLREKELNEREKSLDSVLNKPFVDTISSRHPGIPGIWLVKMLCTETTCPGSAVGDTKTEQWEINYQDNAVIAKAMSDNKLVRIYTGAFTGDALDLLTQSIDSGKTKPVNMTVHLKKIKENEMEGQREIIRPGDCRIVYDLELKKK